MSEKKSSVGMIIGVVAVVGWLCLCCVSICAAGGMYYVIYASQPDPWDYDWGTEWSSGWEDTYTPTASTDSRLADLRSKQGSWIGDYNIDFNSSQPAQFTHYFLVFSGSSRYVSPSAIIVGEHRDSSSAPMWPVLYRPTLADGRWSAGPRRAPRSRGGAHECRARSARLDVRGLPAPLPPGQRGPARAGDPRQPRPLRGGGC